MSRKSRKSSSFARTANHGAFPSVLELGQALVDELGLDRSTDTLGRWMAHYVAELIDAARDASPEARDEAEHRCASAILDLWKRRDVLPGGPLPMNLGSIVAVLDRLDPTASKPFYIRSTWQELERHAEQDMIADSAKAWLGTIEQIDRAAREAIRFALSRATQSEVDRAKRWTALAEAAAADESRDIQIVRRLVGLAANGQDNNADQIVELKGRLSRLAEFRQILEEIEADLKTQLDRLDTAIIDTASSEEDDL